jgi:hypothetical protein
MNPKKGFGQPDQCETIEREVGGARLDVIC